MNPDYTAADPNKLFRVPVYQFSMNFPLFKAGNRTGIAQSAFGTAPNPVCPPFFVFFDNTYPVRTLQTLSQCLDPQCCHPRRKKETGTLCFFLFYGHKRGVS